jgi:hypothetical protein
LSAHKCLKELQLLFNSHVWQMAVIAKRPTMVPTCEPNISRSAVSRRLVIAKVNTESGWACATVDPVDKWREIQFRVKPELLIVLYGREREDTLEDAVLAPTEAAELQLGFPQDNITSLFLVYSRF